MYTTKTGANGPGVVEIASSLSASTSSSPRAPERALALAGAACRAHEAPTTVLLPPRGRALRFGEAGDCLTGHLFVFYWIAVVKRGASLTRPAKGRGFAGLTSRRRREVQVSGDWHGVCFVPKWQPLQ